MWVSTSRPSGERMVSACSDGCRCTTSPPHGATRVFSKGSIDTPSPTIFPANTGSGTCSMGTSTPVTGARSETRVAAGADVGADTNVPLRTIRLFSRAGRDHDLSLVTDPLHAVMKAAG